MDGLARNENVQMIIQRKRNQVRPKTLNIRLQEKKNVRLQSQDKRNLHASPNSDRK